MLYCSDSFDRPTALEPSLQASWTIFANDGNRSWVGPKAIAASTGMALLVCYPGYPIVWMMKAAFGRPRMHENPAYGHPQSDDDSEMRIGRYSR